MKKMILSLVLALTFFGFSGYLYCEAQDIVYVDFLEILDNYKKYADYEKDFEEKRDKEQERLMKKNDAIGKLQEEMKLLKDSEKAKKQQDIDSKVNELTEDRRKALVDLKKESDQKMQDIFTDVKNAIDKYAKKNKIKMVLRELPAVAYADESLDKTKDIIAILNQEYKK